MFDYESFNVWAVLVAAVSSFIIGGLWYGPLLGKAWMEASGMTEEKMQQGHPGMVYGGALALQLVAAWVIAMLAAGQDWQTGLHWGLMLGIGVAATSHGVDCLFEQKPLKLFLVNGGYKIVNYAVMGLIIGAW